MPFQYETRRLLLRNDGASDPLLVNSGFTRLNGFDSVAKLCF